MSSTTAAVHDEPLRATREPLRPTRDALRDAAKPTGPLVVARFPHEQVERAMLVLRARGLVVARLKESAAGPAGLSRELSRAVSRAAVLATALGAFGALVGALLAPGDALLPGWGWLPGPIVTAAFGAGVLGTLGLLVGALSLLFMSPRTLAEAANGAHALVAIEGSSAMTSSLVVARVVECGGEALAFGERAQ